MFYALFVMLFSHVASLGAFSEERSYRFCMNEFERDSEPDEFLYFSDRQADPYPEECLWINSSAYCVQDSEAAQFLGIDEDLLHYLPTLSSQCRDCGGKAVYLGYIDPRFKRYHTHLWRQLKYTKEHKECFCYWPELSDEAAEISNKAYELFTILFEGTALVSLLEDDALMDEFRNTAFSACADEDIVAYCIARQFLFSHYYRLATDLESFAENHFSNDEFLEIKDGLSTILKALALEYMPLYETCLEDHQNKEIATEVEFAKIFLPNLDADDSIEENWEIEIEQFVNKVPRLERYLSGGWYPNKTERLWALNVRPIFTFVAGYPRYEDQKDACKKILKSLIRQLYEDCEFYAEAKDEIPDLEDNFVKVLIAEVEKEKERGFHLKKLADLGKLNIKNKTLNHFRYKILGEGDDFWGSNASRTFYHYSISAFITFRKKSDYLASVWGAPEPLLMAIFEDKDVVDDLVHTRQEIYEALLVGNDLLVKNDELRKRFSDKLGDIDPRFIDFRVNRIQPPNFDFQEKQAKEPRIVIK